MNTHNTTNSDPQPEVTVIKTERDIDFCDTTGDWAGDLAADKLKVEIIEPGDVNQEKITCKTCEVIFINEHELKIHNMIHSSDHTCFICKEFVKNRFQFVGHVRKHMCVKPFRCPNCERTFPTSRETKLHQRVHSDDRPYMCTECGKAFKQITTLKDHEVVHTGEKRFKCKICEGAFATATSLRRHIRVMHETVRSFRCHFCSEAFTSKQALKQHSGIHRDVDPLRCQMCGERTPSEEECVAHRNKHVELRRSGNCEYCGNKTFYFGLKEHIEKMHQPRSCNICNLVFYDDKSIENHSKSHREETLREEFECNVCRKRFEFPRYLKAHMKRHEDNYKRFRCDLCDKTFSSKRDLTDHLNVHADVKNYRCGVCGKAFRTKQSVSKHMPVHSDKRPFQCALCDKRFKKQSILRKHSFTHSRARPFGCDGCDRRYKSKESLRVHRLTHRKTRYHCGVCGKSFQFNTVYKRHECVGGRLEASARRCGFCKMLCRSASTYACHVLVHSRRAVFRCAVCSESLKYRYRLRLHRIRHRSEVRVK